MKHDEPRDFRSDAEAQEAIFSQIAARRDRLMLVASWVRQAASDDSPSRRMALMTEANNAAQSVAISSQAILEDIRLARSRDFGWPRSA